MFVLSAHISTLISAKNVLWLSWRNEECECNVGVVDTSCRASFALYTTFTSKHFIFISYIMGKSSFLFYYCCKCFRYPASRIRFIYCEDSFSLTSLLYFSSCIVYWPDHTTTPHSYYDYSVFAFYKLRNNHVYMCIDHSCKSQCRRNNCFKRKNPSPRFYIIACKTCIIIKRE